MMKNSIKRKLLLSYLLVVGITTILTISILFGFIYFKKTGNTIHSATKLSQIMGTNLSASLSFDDKSSAESILKSLNIDKTLEAAIIYDKNGKIFSYYSNGIKEKEIIKMVKLLNNKSIYNDINNIIVSSKISHDNDELGKLIFIYNTDEIKTTLKKILEILFAISIVIFILMLKISSILQKRLTKPIYLLVDTMEDILEHNNFTKTIKEKRDDEFQTLFDGFNTLLVEIQKNKSKLENMAYTDPLTGVNNRRHFYELVNQFSNMSKREQKISTILMLDIDKFKNVNDTYGHDVGDKVIQELAKVGLENIRKGDIFCRFGGEEFVIFLPHTDCNNAKIVAEKIRTSIELSRGVEDINFTVSIGVGEFIDDIDDAIKKADTALYTAKESGRNRVEIFS